MIRDLNNPEEPEFPRDLSDEVLKDFYKHNSAYAGKFQDKQLLTDRFIKRYHQSLFYYKHFYDDLHEYGNREKADEIIYFIPGFNGTPGQIKFGMPGILKKYGNNIYIKCLYLEEFSKKVPYWIKYTGENLVKRRDKIVSDLQELNELGKRVRVVVSSTAFYDFLAIYHRIEDIKDNMTLYWVSCAPDAVSRSPWESWFYTLNGFTYNGQKWFSYPNMNILKTMNPECSSKHKWKHKKQKNSFQKNDIESRFFCFRLLWDYISTDNFNFVLESNLEEFRKSGKLIDMETKVLAATKDGFWDNSSEENIEKTLDRYLVRRSIIYKGTSHLWVVTPENIYELLA